MSSSGGESEVSVASIREYPAGAAGAPTLVLGHGAGAGQDHPWMTGLARDLAAAGMRVVTFDFPYRAAGRRLPDRAPVLEAAFEAVWKVVATPATGRLFAGGKSMGGRMASQAAARGGLTPPPAGLVFFGYPLHPPRRPTRRRDAHLPAIHVPMLFLHGTRDPFGTPEEMAMLVANLPTAELYLVDGGDHSLVGRGVRKEAVAERVREWVQEVP